MKSYLFYVILGISFFVVSCSSDVDVDVDSDARISGPGQENQSGLITAGEWNDLDHWTFWNELIEGEVYSDKPDYWNFHTNNRVSILLLDNMVPVIDVKLEISKNGETIWEARTDNFGKAEMWIDLFELNQTIDITEFSLSINDHLTNAVLKLYDEGVNEIEFSNSINISNRVELAFIVDATGSMSDEINFLKDDFGDVITRVKNDNSSLDIRTSCVFYRDEGDDYVIKDSKFTSDLNKTIDFINKQSAGGGGDFPEALHTALKTGIEEFQWSNKAKTRIAFLLLDAPPHYESDVIKEIQNSILEAAAKGIKIIPIVASGINKETEFLMRFFSISTNSTYVFITNDSGIGNDHIEASVGEYEVEYLNDLMVRLVKKYTE